MLSSPYPLYLSYIYFFHNYVAVTDLLISDIHVFLFMSSTTFVHWMPWCLVSAQEDTKSFIIAMHKLAEGEKTKTGYAQVIQSCYFPPLPNLLQKSLIKVHSQTVIKMWSVSFHGDWVSLWQYLITRHRTYYFSLEHPFKPFTIEHYSEGEKLQMKWRSLVNTVVLL